MDWECGEWSECENGWQTRECNFVKVAQHTQSEPCPEISQVPDRAMKCSIIAAATAVTETESNGTEIQNDTVWAKEGSLITGAAISGIGDNPGWIPGVAVLILVILAGILVYILIFHPSKK